MKKLIIILTALIIAAAGSLAAYFVVKSNKDEEKRIADEAVNDCNLFSFDSESLSAMEISGPDGTYAISYDGENWNMDDGSLSLDQNFINGIATTLCDLTANEAVCPLEGADLKTYGLDNPTTIKAGDGKNTYIIYVGSMSPTGDSYYASVEGKKNIYTIPSNDGDSLIFTNPDIRNKYLIDCDANDICGIEVKRDGETAYKLTFDTNESRWELPDDFSTVSLDQTSVGSMISVIIRLESMEMIEDNLQDLSKYGFDDPFAELTITTADGKEHTYLCNNYDDKKSGTFVMFGDSHNVATFNPVDIDFIEYTPIDFIADHPYNPNVTVLDNCTITYRGTKLDFDMSSENVKCNGIDINSLGTDAVTAYKVFYNTVVLLSPDSTDTEAKPELKDPVLSVTFTAEGMDDFTADYVSDGNGNYYAFINGEYTNTIVNEEAFTGTNAVDESFFTFCSTVGID